MISFSKWCCSCLLLLFASYFSSRGIRFYRFFVVERKSLIFILHFVWGVDQQHSLWNNTTSETERRLFCFCPRKTGNGEKKTGDLDVIGARYLLKWHHVRFSSQCFRAIVDGQLPLQCRSLFLHISCCHQALIILISLIWSSVPYDKYHCPKHDVFQCSNCHTTRKRGQR